MDTSPTLNESEAGLAEENTTTAIVTKIDYAQITVLSIAFSVCVFGIVSNCLVLHVTRMSKLFDLQHILAIGDLIFCFSYFLASPPRIIWVLDFTYKSPIPGLWCLIYPWFHSFNVGFVWPSIVTIAIALERFLASVYPIWYHQNWENRLKARFVKLIYVVLVLALAPGLVLAANGESTQKQGSYVQCTGYFGNQYYVLQSAFGSLAGILCAILSTVALAVGKQRRKALSLPANDKFLTNQRKMERTVVAIVVSSLLLVSVPSFFRMFEALDLIPIHFKDTLVVVRRYFLIMLLLNSALNFWLYLVFNSQFRKNAMKFIFNRKGARVEASELQTGAGNTRTNKRWTVDN